VGKRRAAPCPRAVLPSTPRTRPPPRLRRRPSLAAEFHAQRSEVMKAAVRPIANSGHAAMLCGIKVNVFDMALRVRVIADGVLPIMTPPNSFSRLDILLSGRPGLPGNPREKLRERHGEEKDPAFELRTTVARHGGLSAQLRFRVTDCPPHVSTALRAFVHPIVEGRKSPRFCRAPLLLINRIYETVSANSNRTDAASRRRPDGREGS
jgi:hypothetical protein